MNKRQRHLKRGIPVSQYCDRCPLRTEKIRHFEVGREFYCTYLNSFDNGEGCYDGVKMCGIHDTEKHWRTLEIKTAKKKCRLKKGKRKI